MLRIDIEDARTEKEVREFARVQRVSPERFVLRLLERGINAAGYKDDSFHQEAAEFAEGGEPAEVSCPLSA